MGRPAFVLDCAAIAPADAAQVERIARLLVSLRRQGWELRLANAGEGLIELIDFAGLAGALRVEAGRQPEEREEAGGVQEEGELGDPTA